MCGTVGPQHKTDKRMNGLGIKNKKFQLPLSHLELCGGITYHVGAVTFLSLKWEQTHEVVRLKESDSVSLMPLQSPEHIS